MIHTFTAKKFFMKLRFQFQDLEDGEGKYV